MVTKIRLISNKLTSKSLKRLAVALSKRVGYKVWRSTKLKPKRLGIRYGQGKDKISQYTFFEQQEIPAPPYTTSYEQAKDWADKGKVVVCRKLIKSSEGKGIVVAEEESQIVMAPVYTQYLPKKKEYRVHVFKGKVVAILEKRKKKGFENVNSKIRNTKNGYVFCRENVIPPEGIQELAIKAAKVSGSDFQGVDIGYNEKKNLLFVIEVNSAPGMEGTTVENYADAIIDYVKSN